MHIQDGVGLIRTTADGVTFWDHMERLATLSDLDAWEPEKTEDWTRIVSNLSRGQRPERLRMQPSTGHPKQYIHARIIVAIKYSHALRTWRRKETSHTAKVEEVVVV